MGFSVTVNIIDSPVYFFIDKKKYAQNLYLLRDYIRNFLSYSLMFYQYFSY